MVVIIDDREDVWGRGCPNLVHVKPYVFFAGTEDINAPPTPSTTAPTTPPTPHSPHPPSPPGNGKPSSSSSSTPHTPSQNTQALTHEVLKAGRESLDPSEHETRMLQQAHSVPVAGGDTGTDRPQAVVGAKKDEETSYSSLRSPPALSQDEGSMNKAAQGPATGDSHNVQIHLTGASREAPVGQLKSVEGNEVAATADASGSEEAKTTISAADSTSDGADGTRGSDPGTTSVCRAQALKEKCKAVEGNDVDSISSSSDSEDGDSSSSSSSSTSSSNSSSSSIDDSVADRLGEGLGEGDAAAGEKMDGGLGEGGGTAGKNKEAACKQEGAIGAEEEGGQREESGEFSYCSTFSLLI